MTSPKDMQEGWKQTLVNYVNALNEAGLQRNGQLRQMLTDPQHRRRLAARLAEEARREAARGIKVTRSEVRVSIERREATGERDASADIAMHIVRTCEQWGIPWQEERVERERIRFVRAGSEWRLDTVELLGPEGRRQVMSGLALTDTPDDLYERRDAMPSLPYINVQPGSGTRSRVYAGGDSDPDRSGFDFYRQASAGVYDAYSRRTPYKREEAAAYAERWWKEQNPAYENFEVNCTNYVSQCLFAGQAPMNYTGRRESGWWYSGKSNGREMWSYSWAVADSLQRYLPRPRGAGVQAEEVDRPDALQIGDVICYDWDGTGRFGHNTIVTAHAPDGAPLVNANTVSSRHRYWDYRDSYAWTERTRYRFLRIADYF